MFKNRLFALATALAMIAVSTACNNAGHSGAPILKNPQGSGRWISVKVGASVPGNALIANVEPNGAINYICRGPSHQALFTGKGVLNKCLIAYGDDQIETDGSSYEVLIGSYPDWERWDPTPGADPARYWFEGGYEDREVRLRELVCLGRFVADNTLPGKLLPFDDDGTCHVEAGGSAFKSNDRNKFAVLRSVKAPIFEDTPSEAYVMGYKENLVNGRTVFRVWNGTDTCVPERAGRYALRSLPEHGYTSTKTDQSCEREPVYKYAFAPGSLQ